MFKMFLSFLQVCNTRDSLQIGMLLFVPAYFTSLHHAQLLYLFSDYKLWNLNEEQVLYQMFFFSDSL